MQRRSLLKLGIASGALLVLGGGAVALLQPGVQQGRLTAAGSQVLSAAARGLLDGSLPAAPAARAEALEGFDHRAHALVAGLPPHAQAELSQLLALLATGAGRRWFAGLVVDWPMASVPDLRMAFESMRRSRLDLRRQAYLALHDLIAGAYFSEPSTWSALGYPGPIAI